MIGKRIVADHTLRKEAKRSSRGLVGCTMSISAPKSCHGSKFPGGPYRGDGQVDRLRELPIPTPPCCHLLCSRFASVPRIDATMACLLLIWGAVAGVAGRAMKVEGGNHNPSGRMLLHARRRERRAQGRVLLSSVRANARAVGMLGLFRRANFRRRSPCPSRSMHFILIRIIRRPAEIKGRNRNAP